MNARPWATRTIGGLALGSVLLAGCASELPSPDPSPTPDEPQPVLTVEQSQEILAAVGEAIAKADEAKDVSQASSRLADPAARARAAQYTLAERSDGERQPTPLTTQEQVLILAASDGWPRTVMAVTQPPEGENAPLLLVLKQGDARGPYKLQSWVRLFPGVETPAMPAPEVGATPLPTDAEGFRGSPADVITWYGSVLARGSESEHADKFGSDPYVEQLQAELKTGRDSLEGIAQINFDALALPDGLVALETADGGALVVGTITTTTGYKKTLSGSTLTLGGEVGDWLGEGDIPALANARHDSMVAFHVPASETEEITVLGAERVLVDASKI